jgi:hypothetical protein
MKQSLIHSVLSLAFLASIPSALADETAPPIWRKLLTCDGGAAVVDVDIQERGIYHTRAFAQVVVRNRDIVRYLRSKGVPANGAGEVIIQGRANRPVYYTHDFESVSSTSIEGLSINAYAWREDQGLKILFKVFHPGRPCPDFCRESPYTTQCDSCGWGSWEEDLGDWYFRGCR